MGFHKKDNTEEKINIDRTDMVNGSKKCNFLYRRYEKFSQKGHCELISRVFHGIPSKHSKVSYNTFEIDKIFDDREIKDVLHLGSYNYSGLNGHPQIIEAAVDTLKTYGTTTSGVRLLNGTSNLHLKLEQKLADFLGYEDCVTFSSGFCANLAVLETLCGVGDVIFSDAFNHESIVKGIALSKSRCVVYPHKDIAILESLLLKEPLPQRKFIITDGVFSMDGDLAPLPDLVSLAQKYNAFLIVDDAHGTASIGDNGRGTVAHFGLTDDVDVVTGSLSKGLPGIGGFVATNLKTALVLRAGAAPYIFSASIPPATAAGLIKALDILSNHPEIQQRLDANANRLRHALRTAGLNILNSESAVIPIIVGGDDNTYRYARRLHDRGLYVNPVVFPAVPKNSSRVRLNVSADLTDDEVDFALEVLVIEAETLGLIKQPESVLAK